MKIVSKNVIHYFRQLSLPFNDCQRFVLFAAFVRKQIYRSQQHSSRFYDPPRIFYLISVAVAE